MLRRAETSGEQDLREQNYRFVKCKHNLKNEAVFIFSSSLLGNSHLYARIKNFLCPCIIPTQSQFTFHGRNGITLTLPNSVFDWSSNFPTRSKMIDWLEWLVNNKTLIIIFLKKAMFSTIILLGWKHDFCCVVNVLIFPLVTLNNIFTFRVLYMPQM